MARTPHTPLRKPSLTITQRSRSFSAPTAAPLLLNPGLLRQHLEQRLNLTTATNRGACWLFPGRRAGQPMVVSTIEIRLRKHGIPTLSGRTAALRQLVRRAPAPVVATMLGYSHDHTARTATTAGTNWSRYAPGDHTRLHDQRTGDS